jgi:type II secretory ATPase GspE/PulE/Tfp pilus assembly ATPase PilB-like protein
MAMKSGMKLLEDDGLEKVKQEITTVEEVMRVTRR